MRWQRMISILLAVSMMFSFGALASAGADPTNSLRISSDEGHPGESVSATVYMTPAFLINKYDVTISYDANRLELEQGNEVTNDLGVSEAGDTFVPDFSVAGEVNVKANLVNYAIFTEDKPAFTLHFKIKDGAQPGELTLDAVKRDLYEGGDLSETTVEKGKINVVVDTYTVTFDSQGGSPVDAIDQVAGGTTIVEPAAPERAGYTFAGWYTDAEGTSAWDFGSNPVTDDLMLYAKWTRNAITIGIGTDSGLPGDTASVSVTADRATAGIGAYGMLIHFDATALEVSTITGEAGDFFDSNYDNEEGWLRAVWADSDGGVTPIAEGAKLFTVSFKIKDGATVGDKTLTVDTDASSGFTVADSLADEMEKAATPGKITVNEQPASYAVTFDTQGGSAVDSVTASSGDTIGAPTSPTKAGYTFAGWYKEAAGTTAWNFATDTVTGNVTLYAKWTALPPDTYAVTFDSQGGSAVGSVTAISGDTISAPTSPTKAGYTFAGWYKEAAGTTAWNFATDTVTGDVTLYAKWTALPPDTYAVSFDSQGGSAVDSVTASSGDTIVAPTSPTKAGYTFAGWYKEAAGTTAWNFAMDTVTGNVTLYAKWTELPPDTYAVTFDSQGGSAVGSVTASSGDKIAAPTSPTKAGYTFAGWYKEAAGTTAWNFATDTVTGNVTLYAKWTSVAPNDPITPPSIPAANDSLQVIVNGVVKDQIAKGATATVNGKTVLTATIDRDKLIEQLKQAADEPVVVVPVTSSVDKVTVLLTGDLVKSMESKQTILEVRTPAGIYRLPAKQIAIDDVAAKLGTQVGLPDIVIHVDIAGSDEAAKERAETAARQGSFTIAAPPITFNVTASFGGQTIDVERFSSYVEREIPLPDGLDPSKVTTAAVVDPNGGVRHVPTFITSREGKYYAVVNSLTNSDYTLIWNPKTFADVEGHWSKQAVSDMASRMIVSGVDAGRFDPDASITRAEFAAIVVRALGLTEDKGSGSVYSDVGAGEWHAGAVAQATKYGLMEGYADGTFGPARTISRQEALAVMVRAMKLAGLATGVNDADALLSKFADRASVASWAKPAVAAAVTNGLIEGRSEGLAPTGQLTRAETAAIVQRFLIRAKLIDNGGAAQD